MKKILGLLLIIFIYTGASAQEKAINGPEIQFNKKEHQIGELHIGDVRNFTYEYTNIGNAPLVLFDVISNCDCTEIEWSKEPILPGKKGVIKLKYTAETPGSIDKFVTVTSNANTYRVILWNKGKVLGN